MAAIKEKREQTLFPLREAPNEKEGKSFPVRVASLWNVKYPLLLNISAYAKSADPNKTDRQEPNGTEN